MICAVIAVLIAYGNIMAGNNLVQRIVPEAIGTEKSVQTVPAAVLEGIERESAYLKNKILNSTNLLDSIVPEGTIYYISPNGNDSNPGKFEEGAWSSLIRVNETEFMPGDIVCFERGGVWRGQLRAREGVTYTAYGSGDKPKIYGSPENAASPEKEEVREPAQVHVDGTPLPHAVRGVDVASERGSAHDVADRAETSGLVAQTQVDGIAELAPGISGYRFGLVSGGEVLASSESVDHVGGVEFLAVETQPEEQGVLVVQCGVV